MDLGVNYQHQVLTDGTIKNFEGIRLGEHAIWTITPRWTLDQKLDLLPQYPALRIFKRGWKSICAISSYPI